MTINTHESDKASARLKRAGIGARVEMTAHAISNGLDTRGQRFGVIAGFGRHKWTVLVRKDGNKHPTGYHVSFWRPVQTKGAPMSDQPTPDLPTPIAQMQAKYA